MTKKKTNKPKKFYRVKNGKIEVDSFETSGIPSKSHGFMPMASASQERIRRAVEFAEKKSQNRDDLRNLPRIYNSLVNK